MSVYENIISGKYDPKLPYDRTSASAVKAYNEEEARLTDLFWADAFEELGIPSNHPKADAFRRLCWQAGHSSGYSEIWIVAQDWAELIQS